MRPQKEQLRVEAHNDHLLRVAGNDPLIGLDELIWNSLDADSNHVDIRLERNAIGGLNKIIIEDDGVGFSLDDARHAFKTLGGSMKSGKDRTPGGRMLHGQKGEGRYRSLALGAMIVWKSTYREGNELRQFELQFSIGSLNTPILSNIKVAEGTKTGCRVEVFDVTDRADQALTTDLDWVIASRFASYLLANPNIHIYVNGKTIDVTSAVERRLEDDISFNHKDVRIDAVISGYFWNSGRLNELFLCREDGVAVEQVKHVIDEPSLSYSAYVRSSYFNTEGSQPYSDMGRMDEVAEEIRKRARRQLRNYVRQILSEKAKHTISDLERKGAYPFEGEPKSEIEKAEREVFDIVASKIYELSPSAQNLKSEDLREKFSIVKDAIGEESTLRNKLVRKLFGLDEQDLRDLDALTDRHGFPRLISLAKQAEHRLEFLQALHYVVYDPDTRALVLERSQLHKIVEKECWIFGEQYRLLVSDQDLWTVLEAHRQLLGRDELVVNLPYQDDINMDEIPDLFLAGTLGGNREGEQEHVIVELKRPSLNLGQTEISQIETYADAVARHDGFDKGLNRWKFILIGGGVQDKIIRTRLSNPNAPPNQLAATDNYEIYVYQWSTIIQNAKARMNFLRHALDYDVSRQRIKEHLMENNPEILEVNRSSPTLGDVLRGENQPSTDSEQGT